MSDLDLSKYEGHTGGPWHPDPYYPIYVWAGEAMVADMPEAGEEAYLARMRGVGRGANSFEQAANARLIADAPLLLAEVRRLLDELKVQREMHNVCLEIHTESESCLHAERELEALRQSHARLLAAVKRLEPSLSTIDALTLRQQRVLAADLRAAVAEAEALHGE